MKALEQVQQSKPRGRPASFCRDDLIIKITNLFWERGYHNLSLNEIAHETGLTRASLYNAFETKEELFLECIEYYSFNSPSAALEKHKAGDNVGALFYKMFNQICEMRSENKKNCGCLIVNAVSELVVGDVNIRSVLLSKQEQRKQDIVNLLKQAENQNELPKDTDVETIAGMILTFMSGLSAFSKTGADKNTLYSMCHTFLKQMGFTNINVLTSL